MPSVSQNALDSDALDTIVLDALQACGEFVAASEWRGRENELVNLYALGYLMPRLCVAGGPFVPTHLGIEVAVPQLPGRSNRKDPDVRKDLVIWRSPSITTWMSPNATPSAVLAVMEWKLINNIGRPERPTQKRREHESDVAWLLASSERLVGLTGYAVFVDLQARPAPFELTIVRAGAVLSHRVIRASG